MSGGFCTDCGYRVEDFATLSPEQPGCPSCGSDSVPCSDTNQVLVSINWHELRILVMWAERYALSIKDTAPKAETALYAIARRIEDQHPDRALDVPLTFAGEVRQLRDAFGAVEIYGNDALDDAAKRYRAINDPPEEP